jgi:predicted glycoside hydrolase/deacetylase ChbG (UPF0249 family)
LKRLIINADDFGFNRDVNAGIVRAHRDGVLTSTTLMANGEAFDEAVSLAQATPSLDVGCHLVLVHGQSLLTGRPLPARPRDLLIALARGHLNVYSELRVQIEKIIAAGIRPTHLDSHKHTHIVPHVFRIAAQLAREFDIPYLRLPLDFTLPASVGALRRYYLRQAGAGVRTTDHFIGFRLTGALNETSLANALRRLPDGTTEFMCHPGVLGSELASAHTRLKESRERELDALTSPAIRRLISESAIHLGPFGAGSHP